MLSFVFEIFCVIFTLWVFLFFYLLLSPVAVNVHVRHIIFYIMYTKLLSFNFSRGSNADKRQSDPGFSYQDAEILQHSTQDKNACPASVWFSS